MLTNASSPSSDSSRALTYYPKNSVNPDQVSAYFTALPAGMSISQPNNGGISGSMRQGSGEDFRASRRDAFTDLISQKQLTVLTAMIGLLIAFGFGAMHALSPGHGKAMVAAYLVGSKGSVRHAVILGLMVTFTHTVGVVLLGIGSLIASEYIVPEKLYPVLTIISGASVCAVGIWSLRERLRSAGSTAHTLHHHDHSHDHFHEHDHGHSHSHGDGHHHHHLPEGEITLKSLIALGFSGGIIPCPSALVVLFAAVALHRIAFGMALIIAFSAGLATVLIAIGIVVLKARNWIDSRAVRPAWQRRIFRFAPIMSAIFVSLIGLALICQAVAQVKG